MENKENLAPPAPQHTQVSPAAPLAPHVHHAGRTPLTPMQSALYNIRKRLETQMSEPESKNNEDKVSPGLATLRSTPGRMKDKQKVLSRKHQEAKTRVKELNVGGGVSLWPDMENMRLTKQEVINLTASCGVLVVLVMAVFKQLHGSVLYDLDVYTGKLQEFSENRTISTGDLKTFERDILKWHTDFFILMTEIQTRFNIDLSQACSIYKVSAVLYVIGICLLLYYLIDNMFAKSKLTPKTIKIWVSLLVVIGTWTLLVCVLLLKAHSLELEVINNVHDFSGVMASVIWSDLDLHSTKYQSMWLYWRTRCLPPTTIGTLRVMGLVPVQDITLYLQYYSWPIVTALVTPIVKLVVSLRELYATRV